VVTLTPLRDRMWCGGSATEGSLNCCSFLPKLTNQFSSAHVARRHEPYASDFAATKARRGTGIALVRTSRKLLTEAFWTLKALEEQTH
jgi:hypothetical protein